MITVIVIFGAMIGVVCMFAVFVKDDESCK